MLTELVADQVAPAYWVQNKDVDVRIYRLKIRRKPHRFSLSLIELFFMQSEIWC